MANAGAVSGSCWPELINAVFFFANASTLLHRADGGCAQATGAAVYLEGNFSVVFNRLSMGHQVSCLRRYDFMGHNYGNNKKKDAKI